MRLRLLKVGYKKDACFVHLLLIQLTPLMDAGCHAVSCPVEAPVARSGKRPLSSNQLNQVLRLVQHPVRR
jgi:hypothetical protein